MDIPIPLMEHCLVYGISFYCFQYRTPISVFLDIDDGRAAATAARTCRLYLRVNISIYFLIKIIFSLVFSSTSSLEMKPLPRLPDEESNKKKKTSSKG